jgi:ubiquinone/menaquinone biosynthesis C-methylase UbiE
MLRSLLRFGFRLLYNEFAWTYDLVSWTVSIGQWRTWQRQIIPRIAGERVLEIAHGTGNLQIDLATAGYRAIAFDLSPHMGRIARGKLARRGLRPPFVRGRAQALPFQTGHFTTIVSTFPTEFISDPPAVREFGRVLAPEGRMVFIPAATIVPAGLADRLARWLFEVTGQSTAPAVDGVEGWPPRLAQVYGAAGFRIRLETVKLPRSLVWIVVADK